MSSPIDSPTTSATPPGKWPKVVPPLTAEERRINDDFMKHWLQVLPKRYPVVEIFNQGYAVRHAPRGFVRTLEIGAGLGGHLSYERLTDVQRANYHALELRQNMADELRRLHPGINTVVGDCQQRLDFPAGFFDRILAIHVLEHLPDLPAAVREMRRLCDPVRGVFSVVIPTEGSPAYTLCRRLSAQRIFEKRYPGHAYESFIRREHLNRPAEILAELAPHFRVERRAFFPLRVPIVALNLCIGLTLRPV